MKIEEAVKQRRSVRQFLHKMPNDEDVQKILQAGTWAPSGLNNQPWKFKIIREKGQKEALARFTKYGKIIEAAPIVICIFLDYGASYNREKDILAVGACVQNMLLQAYEYGLGTCWLGEILNKKEQLIKYLKIKDDLELMAVVCLGYSDEEVTKGCRKRLSSFMLK
ncbi:MAG: nitroreductase family protein [Candidatus Omnitrophica bacterium]|nr:nitroreductase family protein [Candidatus Omnitrophota bacterium]